MKDLATCPGHWYAVGGYLGADGNTSPAAWTSVDDGRTWSALATAPVSVYGPQHVLLAVACRGDSMVAVGAVSGGAHGNLRTGTWRRTGTGPLTEVPAAFELYGGPNQIGVDRATAGPAGFVIAGARVDANGDAGAAVWMSPDGIGFRLVDADPALESDARGQTTAQDAVPTPGGFTLVGSLIPANRPDLARDPLAWTSPDGLHWQRSTLPAAAEDESLNRVIGYRDGLLAVGIRGTGFGAWRESGGSWRAVGRFASLASGSLPQVTGLAVTGSTAYLTLDDGAGYQLWRSSDGASWQRLALPVSVPAGAGHLVTLTGTGDHLLLAADNQLYRS